MSSKYLIGSIIIIIAIAVVLFFPDKQEDGDPISPADIASFEECAAAGNPVMESWPRKCSAGDATFTEDIGNELEKVDFIIVSNPRPNQVIESPLEISGEAVGTWYFEGDFGVFLMDEEGNRIADVPAQADGEWMTEDFVPFTATLEFEPEGREKGTLIFRKDNPSDMRELDDELVMPVLFKSIK